MRWGAIKKLFLSVWRHENGVIHSPLSPQRCAEALESGIDGDMSLFGSRDVLGHVSPEGGVLRRRIFYGNSFRTVLKLKFESRSGGTRVRWSAGPAMFVSASISLWFGFIVLWTAIAIPAAASQPDVLPIFMLAPLVMIFGGVAIVTFGRWLARNEQRFLLAFTAKTLKTVEPRP